MGIAYGANFCCKAYTKSTTVIKPTLSSIAISGVSSLMSGQSAQFSCEATYSDGSKKSISPTWSIARAGQAYAMVSSTGLVTAKDVSDQQTVTVQASYTEDGVTKDATWGMYVTVAAPNAPADVTATQGTESSCVRVNWSAPSGATEYAVYRATRSGSNYAQFLETVTSTRYNDTSATPGVDYWYYIKAKNSSGISGFSAGSQGWRKLSPPDSVTATDNLLDKVRVTWNSMEGASYYRVYRATSMDGSKSALGNWQTSTSFDDTTATAGVTYYYYVVAAVDSSGSRPSDYSIVEDGKRAEPVTVSSLAISGAASIVSGGNATYSAMATYTDGHTASVSPTWSITSGSSYASVSGNRVTAAIVAANQTVTLRASYSESGKTVTGTKAITISAAVPAVPQNLTANPSSSPQCVTLAWSAVAGAASYKVYRGGVNVGATSSTTCTDSTATPGASYTYTVSAVNVAGESAQSSGVTATVPLVAPSGVTATSDRTDGVAVSWSAVNGATHYRVARATSATGAKTELGSWQTGRTYTDTSATAGTAYWYFVRAATSSGGANASAYSSSAQGMRRIAVTLSSVAISGANKVAASKTAMYSCTASYSDGTTKTMSPSWSVSPSSAATIDAGGKLTAKAVTANATATITASFTDGVTKTATKDVTIVAPIQATAEVRNVTVTSRWPFRSLLDIDYELVTSPSSARASVSVFGRDEDHGVDMAAFTLSGDGAGGTYIAAGQHRLTWDIGADYTNFHAKAFSVTMTATPSIIGVPENVTISASTSGVTLNWNAVEDATDYEIWRGTGTTTNGTTRIATVTDATTYFDGTGTAGTTYRYWLRATGEDGIGEFAQPITGTRIVIIPISLTISGASTVTTGSSTTYTCTVTRNDGTGGTVTPTWSITSGSSYASISSSGTLTAYGTATQQNVTIQATYTQNGTTVTATKTVTINTKSVTITFNANGGSVSPTSQSYTAYGTYGSLPSATRTGYTFGGWHTASDNSGSPVTATSTVPASDTTIYVHWTVNTYTVTLDQQSGSGGTSSVTATYGSAMPSITVPTRSGYTFGGYYTDTNGSGTQYYTASGASARTWNLTSATTLYAKWTANSYTSTYIVIDLSSGANASSYPVTAMDSEPSGGFNTDEYKTTKLVLRKLSKGTYWATSWNGQSEVSISNAFYIGVFEITQKQYELVMGDNPSLKKGDMRPADSISWDMIRGESSTYDWPSSLNVNPSSFMGKLRLRTGIEDIDLPTSSQWEYACRAGTTTDYNNGESTMNGVGRYSGNTSDGRGGYSEHTKVGSYSPNNWGLYDMHGNVWEWCLDRYNSSSSRVLRGGSWMENASRCTSSDWDGSGSYYSSSYGGFGFRICCVIEDGAAAHGKVQLWEGGPYWAETNIGAEKPEDYGYYFWWGDTVGYRRENNAWVATDGSSSNFQFYYDPISQQTYNKNITTLQSEGWIVSQGGTYVLAPTHDAAHVKWGGDWRMPTQQEQSDLCNNCDWMWTTKNGVNGYEVRGRGDYASNSIFLPCAGGGNRTSLENSGSNGGYWSSALLSDDYYSWYLYFYSGGHRTSSSDRRFGFSIRPVQGFTTYIETTVTFDQQGGSGGTASVTATYGSAMPAITVPTRSGYTFGGYWTGTNGSGTQYYAASGESARTWDLASATTLYAKWTANASDGHAKVQLWEGGPYWATTNIGAGNPEDSGYYFWWGDTVGYRREGDTWVATDGSSSNFSFSTSNTPTYNKKVATLQSEGWIISQDGTYVLAPAHDAAHVKWGGNWRMPTYQEQCDLIDNCDWSWTTKNGVNGYEVRGRGAYASNSIFLPCAGYGWSPSFYDAGSIGLYWSSVPDSSLAWSLYFYSSDRLTSSYDRNSGRSVRPVQDVYVAVTVAFDGNGGTPSSASMSGVVGNAYGTLPTATRAGYTFAGWFTAPAGGIQVTEVSLFDEEITTLYAHWTANPASGETYLVIDLSGGMSASSYSVSYLSDVPSGGWTDEYKTTKLVMRKIPAGSFIMGCETNEIGYTGREAKRHTVTISRPFYIGVFPVTQRQYELVTGNRPSYFSNASCYQTRPVERVSWDDIRGDSSTYDWPNSADVAPLTFMGKIRSKTGIDLDLPTEAKWEYACRAGTTTAFNNGTNLESVFSSDTTMNALGRHWHNGGSDYGQDCTTVSGTAAVGSYLPNNWGLYDMHGNVWEWCLDWFQDRDSFTSASLTDPLGPALGSGRVQRGGCFGTHARSCRSAERFWSPPSNRDNGMGFRLYCPTGGEVDSVTIVFDGNGGTPSEFSRSYPAYGTYGELPTATREGYTFVGWWTAASDGTQVTVNSTISASNTTLYAHWIALHAKVQLWEGGPYWATTNIGAENPEDSGYYFWWGDTIGYKRENDAWVASDGSSSNFSFSSGNTPTYNKDITTLQSGGWVVLQDGKYVLVPAHDAAHVHWGGNWRMPTKQELDNLNSNCDWTWTTQNGVKGYIVRGRGNYASNSIFLPCAGYGAGTSLYYSGSDGYSWSSVPFSASSYNFAWDLNFYSGGLDTYYKYRYLGQSVRPIQGFAN